MHTGIESIFQCQFHTAVVGEELRLVYKKGDLDDAFKDKRFGDNVRVELLFKTIEGYNAGECVCVCHCVYECVCTYVQLSTASVK